LLNKTQQGCALKDYMQLANIAQEKAKTKIVAGFNNCKKTPSMII